VEQVLASDQAVCGQRSYDQILARRSVRRYDARPLDPAALAQVEQAVAAVEPLVPGNRWTAALHTSRSGEDLVAALGGYGRIGTPPHYLVLAAAGDHSLVDAGFRAEQIAVQLAGLGLGSCFVGALGRESAVRERFGLPGDSRIAAFLAFGRPTESVGGRALNATLRLVAGATNKLAPDRLFHVGSFDRPELLPAELRRLVEAERSAPSAKNTQPWRFLWRERRLFVFVKRSNPPYDGPRADYRYHDGGACLANLVLALRALGRPATYDLCVEGDSDLPQYPDWVEPLAVVELRS